MGPICEVRDGELKKIKAKLILSSSAGDDAVKKIHNGNSFIMGSNLFTKKINSRYQIPVEYM